MELSLHLFLLFDTMLKNCSFLSAIMSCTLISYMPYICILNCLLEMILISKIKNNYFQSIKSSSYLSLSQVLKYDVVSPTYHLCFKTCFLIRKRKPQKFQCCFRQLCYVEMTLVWKVFILLDTSGNKYFNLIYGTGIIIVILRIPHTSIGRATFGKHLPIVQAPFPVLNYFNLIKPGGTLCQQILNNACKWTWR